MKRILVISSASIHTKKFLRMMEGHYELYLLTNRGEFFEECPLAGVFEWQKNPLKNVMATRRLLRRIAPDLVHIHQVGLLAFFYTFLLHRRYRILLTAWGSDLLLFPYRSLWNRWMTAYTLRHARILSSTDSIVLMAVMRCLSGFRRPIVPINFGIAEEIVFETYDRKENIIYSPRGHRTLYNIETVLRSFALLLEKEPMWRLVVGGLEDPVNTPRYKRLAKELGVEDRIAFLGHVSQQEHAEILRKSRIVVSVPKTDGRPVSVLEAIASNCTLICSDIPANHELVRDGINGIIVDHTAPFDIGEYHRVDIELQTRYNRKYAESLTFENARRSFLEVLEKILAESAEERV